MRKLLACVMAILLGFACISGAVSEGLEAPPASGEREASLWTDEMADAEAAPGPKAIAAPAAEGLAVSKEYFPDKAFRSYVAEQYDTNGDGFLSGAEIKAVKEISVYDLGISSLKGIEFFPALTSLYCDSNKLKKLDVSKNVKLKELFCRDNKIKALDVSKNTNLTLLNCWNNKLKKLDVSKLKKLVTLGCGGNSLKKLDVTANSKLKELNCAENGMTSLELGSKKSLMFLDCGGNKIGTIDLAGCPKLIKALKYLPYSGRDTYIHWGLDEELTFIMERLPVRAAVWSDKDTTLMKGKTLLYKPGKPKSIKFSQDTMTVKEGKRFVLPAIVAEPEGVAAVDCKVKMNNDGVWEAPDGTATFLEAMEKGKTKVTVTTKNGKKATITIIVN